MSEVGQKINGCVGPVVGFDEKDGRWEVEIEMEVVVEGSKREIEVAEKIRVREKGMTGTRDAGKFVVREKPTGKVIRVVQTQQIHRMARKVKSLKSENLYVVHDVSEQLQSSATGSRMTEADKMALVDL